MDVREAIARETKLHPNTDTELAQAEACVRRLCDPGDVEHILDLLGLAP